ncbi:MAG TPA: PQQ-binding-like beta-propeller repeat protein [Candidatus Acidoferrales bacterium]|nr:PQQ-binding-like beta-propeller repeat protein [Candidatus Acidoferrales bacterium]
MKIFSVGAALVAFVLFAMTMSAEPLVNVRIGPSANALLDAGRSDADWALPAHTYAGNRYVRENRINRDNVATLQRAWTSKLPDDATMEAAPIVWQGTVYVSTGNNSVYALDAQTGAQRWHYTRPMAHAVAFWVNRGVALLEGKVFLGTLDGHLIALDARNGRVVWDVVGVHDTRNSFYSMAPVAYKNLILIGASNGDWGGSGYLTAFNAATGTRAWEWHTIPAPGEPGHETWAGSAWQKGGGSIWGGLAIDPATSTLFVDVGNPQPDFVGTTRAGKNLYTDSMVALDISGPQPRVRWYYQFTPHDMHDWDAAMPPVLFTGRVGGTKRSLVATGDKGGNFWILDARDGTLVHHSVVSTQRGASTAPTANGTVTCPGTNGGVQYNGGSFMPETNAFYIPSIDQCETFKTGRDTNPANRDLDLGGPVPLATGRTYGWMSAIDVDTGKFMWRQELPLPQLGGALSLGSGIVFTGQLNGEFDAYDARNGSVLWKFSTGSAIAGPASSYTIGDRQFVIVGSGNANPNFVVPGMPATNAGALVTAFTLP